MSLTSQSMKCLHCLQLFVSVCICVHTFRTDKNVPERSSATYIAIVDSHGQHPVLEDEPAYSTVDDTQQQIIVLTSNPGYNMGFERSQQPMQRDDHAHCTSELSQEQEMVTHGPMKAHGPVHLKEAASAK